MKFLVVMFVFALTIQNVGAQDRTAKKISAPKVNSVPAATPTPSEKSRFDAAIAIENPLERAAALRSFLDDFPENSRLLDVSERLVAARADGANAMLQSGQPTEAINLLKTTVNEAPTPISPKIFSEVISKFPMMLFLNGQPAASAELAVLIEKRVEGDAGRLRILANFFISTENSTDALRLAREAVAIDPTSAVGHQILGIAHRLNFDIENSVAAYRKALELDPESASIKLSLAQLLRAAGKPSEALELITPVLAVDEKNAAAQTVEVLTLFDLGKKVEAEAAFDRSMKVTPGNVALVASVAYWYAANGDGPNAVLHAEEAIDLEPRFVWGHIALGRGLMIEKKYAEAEQALIKARKYGRFPSLEYEIAAARVAGGFYREAAEDLRGIFTVKDGRVETDLGGRISRSAATFSELLADERRASIFEPRTADQPDISKQLASLVSFDQIINAPKPDAEAAGTAAANFASGSDAMQLYRQLYAATGLLEKSVAPTVSLELTRSAVARVEDGVSTLQSSGAVMAAELYDARRGAFQADQFVIVPVVPKPILSAIVRGRIEETAGWALFEQGDLAGAEVRLRRAITVLPADSAWWRSSMWRMGATLEASGKDKEALEAYVASYRSQPGSGSKYLSIRSIYQKVNGNTDDLDKLIGPNPVQLDNIATVPGPEPTPEPKLAVEPVVAEPVTNETTTPFDAPQTLPAKTNKVIDMPESPAQSDETKRTPTEPLPTAAVSKVVPIETAELPLADPKVPSVQTVNAADLPVAGSPKTEPAATGTRSIFDPVIITIPNRNQTKAKPIPDTNTEPASGQSEKVGTPESSAPVDQSSGSVRARVIEGVPETVESPACTLNVSQSNVSLVNGLGSVAILVGVGADGGSKAIAARSSSPDDVAVTVEPEIEGISGRSLYLIRSISSKTGIFQVTFQSTCGKKEVIVRVR